MTLSIFSLLCCFVAAFGVAFGEEFYLLENGAESFEYLSVASSGQLLARSTSSVYLLSSLGDLEGTRQGRAVAFLQSDDLSSDHALFCSEYVCRLLPLSDISTTVWMINVTIHELAGGQNAISVITKKSFTEISLNTGQVNPGTTSFYLDAIRYDFEFQSANNYVTLPPGYSIVQSNNNQLCTGCTAKFLQVFSVGTNSYYVAIHRGEGEKTYFYHTRNADLGRRFGNFLRSQNLHERREFFCTEEISVMCGGQAVADHVHFSRAATDNEHRLFMSFGGLVCQYQYNAIKSIFASATSNLCGVTSADPSLLLNITSELGTETIAAMGSVLADQHRFLLLAFRNGVIYKYLVTMTAILLDETQLPDGEVAMEIVASRDGLSYYVMTEKKIHRFPIQNCSQHLVCDMCVSSANPLCGWCSVEGRCGLRGECPNAEQPRHFISHGSLGQCPSITMVTPSTVEIVDVSNITLTTMNFPVNDSLSYECRYVFEQSGNEFTFPATAQGGGVYECRSPSMEALNPIIQSYAGEASPMLQLIRNVGTQPRVIAETTNITYFDCQSYKRCGGCVSQSTCQWCAESATCDPKGRACSAAYTEVRFCPQITPTRQSRMYTLFAHVNQNKNLSIPVSFQDGALPADGDYKCVFVSGGAESVVSGALQSSAPAPPNEVTNTFINCNHHIFSTGPVEDQQVEVRFTLPSRQVYTLDNPNSVQVFVYDCGSADVRDCSQCVTLPEELGCGYCRESLTCSFSPDNSCGGGLISTSSSSCPINITQFMPSSGPIEGGTTITITGFNLPLSTDNVNITIGSVSCTVLQSSFQPAAMLECTTDQSPATSHPIRIEFFDASNTRRIIQTSTLYTFEAVTLTSVEPKFGIVSGGTMLTLRGLTLLSGSRHKIELEVGTGTRLPCTVNEEYIQPDSLQCTTPPHVQAVDNVRIWVAIDNKDNIQLPDAFSYEDDPEVTSITPNQSLALGGIPFTVTGKGFDAVQNPRMSFRLITSRRRRQSQSSQSPLCRVVSSTQLECPSPSVSATPTDTHVAVTLTLDGLTVSDQGPNVTVLPNPSFEPIAETISQVVNSYMDITIKGSNIEPNFVHQFLAVHIGNSPLCKIISITTVEVVCRPGNITEGMVDILLNITVKLGNQQAMVGHIMFEREFNYLLFVVLPILAVILVCAVLVLIVACCICQRRVKKKTRRVDELQEELHQIESSVVSTVKAGFAELNAEVEETYGDQMHQQLPFRVISSYVHFTFFQEEKPPLVTEPLGSSGRSRDFVQGLSDFKRLLSDKKFLLTVVATLEEKKSFDISNRSQFATLLMIALCGKLDYATEVLKQLLSNQIRQLAARGETHLFMRKTQSVSDKMLTCWLALCLRDHVENTTAYPLYMLYRATKTQLDKGPVDVVTGESKYSLSERSILRSIVDKVEEVSVIVETDDGGKFPVKLLDCDTVTQAKEKIIDAAFRSVKASQRYTLQEVDLQFRTEDSTPRLLRDEDKTSLVEGAWRKINTLKHYRVPLSGAVFRLVPRKEDPPEGHVFDHIGTLVASHTLTRRHRLSSITSDGLHLWHLSKQMDHTNGNSPFASRKLMTEIFFPQMMYTKNVLQKYVDDFVESAFTVYGKTPYNGSPGSVSAVYANVGTCEVPHAIKYLFDLLDSEAADNGIHNPSILHVWKCNSLILRFWVNLVKNPEFVFDVHKSHAVDSCLSVIAQALMDSCSTTDEVLTRDAPAGRLLFHKDVRRYRQSVKKYIEDIRRRPPLVAQQMKNYLQNLSQTYNAELLHARGGGGVDMSRVLYELFESMVQYSDEIEEALDCAGLLSQSQSFRSIKRSIS